MNKLGLSHLRLKKVGELLKLQLGIYILRKNGEIRYGRNLIDFLFHPERTSLLEIFTTTRSKLESTIDTTYSEFILNQYSIKDKGVAFKFNTIRNLFKDSFRSKEYMINHYSNKLSMPIIKFLKKEFKDVDILNFVIPAKINVMARIREFEGGIYDHVMKDFALLRAGPHRSRDPILLVVAA
jgi:hypothetical protein